MKSALLSDAGRARAVYAKKGSDDAGTEGGVSPVLRTTDEDTTGATSLLLQEDMWNLYSATTSTSLGEHEGARLYFRSALFPVADAPAKAVGEL